jgi:Tol biopolymer transport system component
VLSHSRFRPMGKPRSAQLLSFLLVVVSVVGAGRATTAAHEGNTPFEGLMKIVFVAAERRGGEPTGAQALYSVYEDGSGFRRLTKPQDGFDYDWATWAFNGTKIVFTARDLRVPNSPDAIYLMDADGSNRIQLTRNGWRNGQPKLSPDGRSILFTSFWDEFPDVGLYLLDLETLQVKNLSSVNREIAARDSDPRWSDDGSMIVFANSLSDELVDQATQIMVMKADGTERKWVTADPYFNTDPSLSRDNRLVAISSYRGGGSPQPEDAKDRFHVKLDGWQLVVREIGGGERVLTKGLDCWRRVHQEPCSAEEAPAWIPQWSPDGSRIGFTCIRSARASGICEIAADGSGAWRIVYESSQLAVAWWSWVMAGSAWDKPIRLGASAPKSALLYGGKFTEHKVDKGFRLSASTPDHWQTTTLSTGNLVPKIARWSADRRRIVFSAEVAFDPSNRPPDPALPEGSERFVHFVIGSYLLGDDDPPDTDAAREQVFIMNTDGSELRQLTTPWTEDYLDALPDDDVRGNGEPDVSPDGQYVIFTNRSTIRPESFILRLDLETGEVLNLTSVTSGAVAVADTGPRFSPDGKRIAFSSVLGGSSQIFVMDSDGNNVTQLSDDEFHNFSPAWSPDGRSLAFGSYRGESPLVREPDPDSPETRTIELQHWQLIRLDLETRASTVLTPSEATPTLRPVWSPDGSSIAFISVGKKNGNVDIFVVPAGGGSARQLAVTLQTSEEFVDWR